MAVFTGSTADRLNSLGDNSVKNYLYKLNEDLIYMFNNLTPEDNYSQDALNVFASAVDRTAELSVSVDGIFANYLKGDSLIASIALDDSGATISGTKINLNGSVAVNNADGKTMVSIDAEKGTLRAVNGYFSGEISNDGFYSNGSFVSIGDFCVDPTSYGRGILQSIDECTGMSMATEDDGKWLLWAGYGLFEDDKAIFSVNQGGQVHIEGELWVNGKKIE